MYILTALMSAWRGRLAPRPPATRLLCACLAFVLLLPAAVLAQGAQPGLAVHAFPAHGFSIGVPTTGELLTEADLGLDDDDDPLDYPLIWRGAEGSALAYIMGGTYEDVAAPTEDDLREYTDSMLANLQVAFPDVVNSGIWLELAGQRWLYIEVTDADASKYMAVYNTVAGNSYYSISFGFGWEEAVGVSSRMDAIVESFTLIDQNGGVSDVQDSPAAVVPDGLPPRPETDGELAAAASDDDAADEDAASDTTEPVPAGDDGGQDAAADDAGKPVERPQGRGGGELEFNSGDDFYEPQNYDPGRGAPAAVPDDAESGDTTEDADDVDEDAADAVGEDSPAIIPGFFGEVDWESAEYGVSMQLPPAGIYNDPVEPYADELGDPLAYPLRWYSPDKAALLREVLLAVYDSNRMGLTLTFAEYLAQLDTSIAEAYPELVADSAGVEIDELEWMQASRASQDGAQAIDTYSIERGGVYYSLMFLYRVELNSDTQSRIGAVLASVQFDGGGEEAAPADDSADSGDTGSGEAGYFFPFFFF